MAKVEPVLSSGGEDELVVDDYLRERVNLQKSVPENALNLRATLYLLFYNGIFPCLRGKLDLRLLRVISKALMILIRVSSG